jgi:sec-independent protein translocase protein TatB
MSAHFRSGIDAMVREAELEDMEKKWKAQNEEIMRRSAALTEAEAGAPMMTGPPPIETPPIETPAIETPPIATPAVEAPLQPPPQPARPAIITIGGNAADLDPPPSTEPILPAKVHLADDDV